MDFELVELTVLLRQRVGILMSLVKKFNFGKIDTQNTRVTSQAWDHPKQKIYDGFRLNENAARYL